MAQHYRDHPLSTSAVCGVDMIGRRNSVVDRDPASTACPECKKWLKTQELLELLHPDPWGQAEQRSEYMMADEAYDVRGFADDYGEE